MDKTLWLQSLAIGKRGEELVKSVLDANYCWVDDVSNSPEYRRKDIDLIVDGTTVEVKNDLKSNYTNNVFVETQNINNISRNGKGWAAYCEADYLCFV
jgi:hypothetical protein